MVVFESSFTQNIKRNFNSDPNESAFDALFREYEHVIFKSVVTAFGLDMFIKDQYGGDVDTIFNVRKIGEDPKMHYKNASHANAYDNRGEYNHKDVEGTGTNFQKIKHDAREKYYEDPLHNTVHDEYEDIELGFLGKSKNHPTDKSAELDHVISAKSIHDDRGRVLAGKTTAELADMEDNLKWTNEHLNKSMSADEIPDYIEKHPELPEDVKKRMMDAYEQARATYEKELIKSYYFDFNNPNCRQFYKDAALSAGKRGLEMGIRQAVGFAITEIWFSIKDELKKSDGTFEGCFKAITIGLNTGSEIAIRNYGELIDQFGEGLLSGILSSISTTIINTFFTTTENMTRILRQAWSSIVEATSILFFNDKEQYFCDRMTSAAKVLSTGASVIVGTIIEENVQLKLSSISIPDTLKKTISVFAGSLCTGIMSVSLLFYIDNGPFTKYFEEIYGKGNKNLKEQARLFKAYCAELEKIDVERLNYEANYVFDLMTKVDKADNQQEINVLLRQAVSDLRLPSIFGGYSLDERMNDKEWVLTF